MNRALEAFEYRDPAEVAEIRELRDMAAAARAKKRGPIELIHKRRRIKALTKQAMRKGAA